MKHEQQADLPSLIRAKRKEKGMTQIDLAQKLGMSIASLRNIEQGLKPTERMRKLIINWLQS